MLRMRLGMDQQGVVMVVVVVVVMVVVVMMVVMVGGCVFCMEMWRRWCFLGIDALKSSMVTLYTLPTRSMIADFSRYWL